MCSMLLLLHDAPGAGLCDAAAAGFSISTHRGFRFSHHEGGDALASLGLNWGGVGYCSFACSGCSFAYPGQFDLI